MQNEAENPLQPEKHFLTIESPREFFLWLLL